MSLPRTLLIAFLAALAVIGLAGVADGDSTRQATLYAVSGPVPEADEPTGDSDLGRQTSPAWTGSHGSDRRDVASVLTVARVTWMRARLEGSRSTDEVRVAPAVATPLFLAHCALLC